MVLQNHQTLKTTRSKHVLMGQLVDNGASMYPKWTSSLELKLYVDP